MEETPAKALEWERENNRTIDPFVLHDFLSDDEKRVGCHFRRQPYRTATAVLTAAYILKLALNINCCAGHTAEGCGDLALRTIDAPE